MLPSDRSERRVKRWGTIIIVIMALIFLIWMITLIVRTFRGALTQRTVPDEEGRGLRAIELARR